MLRFLAACGESAVSGSPAGGRGEDTGCAGEACRTAGTRAEMRSPLAAAVFHEGIGPVPGSTRGRTGATCGAVGMDAESGRTACSGVETLLIFSPAPVPSAGWLLVVESEAAGNDVAGVMVGSAPEVGVLTGTPRMEVIPIGRLFL